MALFGRPTERDDQRARDYRDWLRRRNPLAIASLVLGCLSLTHAGLLVVDAVAGIVLGAVALTQLRRATAVAGLGANSVEPARPGLGDATPDDETPVPKVYGYRLAWTGIALSGISLAAAAIIYVAPWRH